jgi:predicted Zn-dependent peptidase
LEQKVNAVTVQDILESAQRNFDPTKKVVLICKEEVKNEA